MPGLGGRGPIPGRGGRASIPGRGRGPIPGAPGLGLGLGLSFTKKRNLDTFQKDPLYITEKRVKQ